VTLSLSENDDGDSSDSNPIDFCSSNDLLAAASGDMIKIFKIQSGHRVRVLSSIKLFGKNTYSVLDLAIHPSGECIAVGCSDGGLRIFRCDDGRLINHTFDPSKQATCSTCQWWVNPSSQKKFFLSDTLNIYIYQVHG
jgi:WD40 repeat protein